MVAQIVPREKRKFFGTGRRNDRNFTFLIETLFHIGFAGKPRKSLQALQIGDFLHESEEICQRKCLKQMKLCFYIDGRLPALRDCFPLNGAPIFAIFGLATVLFPGRDSGRRRKKEMGRTSAGGAQVRLISHAPSYVEQSERHHGA